ncbi:hypothetical protein [Kineococcus sp. SYSU DK006]|uniref:hypothetical protein n=1 Tax=Kineococcus sp. SYSU DK006 TaxID=3383127 RepID=UPI003D7C96AE
MDSTRGSRRPRRWPGTERGLLVAVAALTFASFVVVYLVEPARTVHPDLWRLYSTMNPVDRAANVVIGALWLAGVHALTLAGSSGSSAARRWSARRPKLAAGLRVAIALAVLGAVAVSALVADVFVGVNVHLHAEDLGVAPPNGSIGEVVTALALVGACLVGLAALTGAACAVGALSGRAPGPGAAGRP